MATVTSSTGAESFNDMDIDSSESVYVFGHSLQPYGAAKVSSIDSTEHVIWQKSATTDDVLSFQGVAVNDSAVYVGGLV